MGRFKRGSIHLNANLLSHPVDALEGGSIGGGAKFCAACLVASRSDDLVESGFAPLAINKPF